MEHRAKHAEDRQGQERQSREFNARPRAAEAAAAEPDIPNSADAARRRRLVFRAWRRGIREMDLLLGTYADRHITKMSAAELDALEHIMAFEDNDLLSFFTGAAAVPASIDLKLFQAILAGLGEGAAARG